MKKAPDRGLFKGKASDKFLKLHLRGRNFARHSLIQLLRRNLVMNDFLLKAEKVFVGRHIDAVLTLIHHHDRLLGTAAESLTSDLDLGTHFGAQLVLCGDIFIDQGIEIGHLGLGEQGGCDQNHQNDFFHNDLFRQTRFSHPSLEQAWCHAFRLSLIRIFPQLQPVPSCFETLSAAVTQLSGSLTVQGLPLEMEPMSKTMSLFVTQVHQSPLLTSGRSSLRRELRKECYQIADFDEAGQKWSYKNYPGGFTSYGSMDRLHEFSSTFAELRKHLDRHVASYVRKLEMDIHPKELQMSSCWINIMPEAVVHTMHIHPLSVISGTYYVETPSGSGKLKLEDPRMECFMASPPRKLDAKRENQRFILLEPKAGEVILFESWLRHEVTPNLSEKERISISFNYDWVRR